MRVIINKAFKIFQIFSTGLMSGEYGTQFTCSCLAGCVSSFAKHIFRDINVIAAFNKILIKNQNYVVTLINSKL